MGMIADSMVDEWDSSLPKTDGIYSLIEKTMDSRSPKVRIWAITSLGNSGDPRAVRSLIDCCQDQSPEIRLCAIEGLQSLRSGRAVDVLIERLRDKDELPKTRLRAAAALATIRSFGAIRELKNRHADPDEDGALRTFIGGELDRVKIW
ncbi:MAG: HEAT repeat domain-containing protein [Methanoregula sp.]|nr:HEAT repeat domain-containing protein [Methanoregula sp.]